jgi:protein TonB
MQTNTILSAPLIDLIFDGRNKAYGAYELRKTYSSRMIKALCITFLITALLVSLSFLSKGNRDNSQQVRLVPGVELTDLTQIKEPEPEPKPEPQLQQTQVKTEPFTDINIVPDSEQDNPPSSVDDLANAQVGTEKRDGADFDGTIVNQTPVSPGNGGIIDQPVTKESEAPLEIVEIDAKFNGNWVRFLERNLDANVPVNNEAPAGRYSVVIRFVVDKEGTVSEITPLTNHGYGMEEESVRVLKKAAKWEPAIQNGNKVKAYRKQVIVFEVLGE